MISDRDFMFYIYNPCGKTLFMPRSRLSAKVKMKYQGRFEGINCVSKIHLVLFLILERGFK